MTLNTPSDSSTDDTRLQDFTTAFIKSWGFDPSGIYCIDTGKQIGVMNPDELLTLLDLNADVDYESLIDDVAMRCLASMRPSIHWNKLRLETYDDMRKRQPLDTLAYLLNRLFTDPLNPKAPRTFDEQLRLYAGRIELYQLLSDWTYTPAIQKMLNMLIQIDGLSNLASMEPPCTYNEFCRKAAGFDGRIKLISDWYSDAIAAHMERLEQDRRTQRWAVYGNPLAKQAMKNTVAETMPPPTVRRKKLSTTQQKLQKEASALRSVVADIMKGATESIKPASAEASPRPVKAPFKLKLGKIGKRGES